MKSLKKRFVKPSLKLLEIKFSKDLGLGFLKASHGGGHGGGDN